MPAVPGPMIQTARVQSKALSAVTIMPVPISSKGAVFWIIWNVRMHGQKKPMQHSIGSMQQPKRVAFHGPGAAPTAVISFGTGTAVAMVAMRERGDFPKGLLLTRRRLHLTYKLGEQVYTHAYLYNTIYHIYMHIHIIYTYIYIDKEKEIHLLIDKERERERERSKYVTNSTFSTSLALQNSTLINPQILLVMRKS